MATQQAASARDPAGRWLGRLGVATTIGMLIVVAMGDLVTNAGAADGCGRSWPLCHGQLVPTFTPQTLIEFGHRLVVGFVSIGVIALAVGLFWRAPWRREAQVLAPALIVFLLLQAVLGGMAVLWPQSPPILALHMGISLISFATVLLATALVLEEGAADRLRDRPVPPRFRRLVWLTLAYLYVLVYLGAFVRHSNADLACAGWPTCNGALLPPLHGLALINFVHRVAALGGALLYLALFLAARPLRRDRPDLYRGSVAALVALLAQAGSGALVATLGMPLWTALLHGALVTLVFGATSYLCLHVLPRPTAARERSAAAAAIGAGQRRQVAAVTSGG
jgi:cytochrome c oxidase assembly protein subunit 15